MAVDTFMAYVGVYPSVDAAEADYQLVKDLHTEAGLIDAYDAAVIERRDFRSFGHDLARPSGPQRTESGQSSPTQLRPPRSRTSWPRP